MDTRCGRGVVVPILSLLVASEGDVLVQRDSPWFPVSLGGIVDADARFRSGALSGDDYAISGNDGPSALQSIRCCPDVVRVE